MTAAHPYLSQPFCEIPLTRGFVALVDADLYPILSKHKWHATPLGYGTRKVCGHKAETRIWMHHEVLRLRGVTVPQGLEPDHINRTPPDNRSANLRLVDRSTQNRNRRIQSNNTSGYRGASLDKRRGRWEAYIKVRGKKLHLGCYPTAKEASVAYEAARDRMGLLKAHESGI